MIDTTHIQQRAQQPRLVATRAMAATMATARALLARLNDPRDVAATCAVCAVLLLGECVLCGLTCGRCCTPRSIGAPTWTRWADISEASVTISSSRATPALVRTPRLVYIYAWLKQLTGGDIFLGQCAFVGVYVIYLAIVLVYAEARCSPGCSRRCA